MGKSEKKKEGEGLKGIQRNDLWWFNSLVY